jgi:hypothetical protein
VEDTLKQLGTGETNVSELKSQVSGIFAILPHLVTNADVADVRTEVAGLRTDLANFRAEVAQRTGELVAAMSGLETRIVKWIIATLLTSTGLAFTIAKFVH